jgi:hypothetical protein
MDSKKHEQIGGSVALVFAVVAFNLPRFGRDWRANLANKLDRAYMNGGMSSHQLPTKAIAYPSFIAELRYWQ